jgi:hypothetical protein
MMESADIRICKGIGQLLYDAAPSDAKMVVLRAELSADGEAARFEYEYMGKGGSTQWFEPKNPVTDRKLREHLVEHRAFFVSQNQAPWTKCELSLDVETGKFSLQPSYDSNTFFSSVDNSE